jgi:hypothetical protein
MLSACVSDPVSTGTDPLASVSVVISVPGPIGAPGCTPGSPSTRTPLGLEIQGITEEGDTELWAMFETQGAVRSRVSLQVWWHVPGDGPLKLTLVGPGNRIEPTTGRRPAVLEGWDRPGEPWVSRITFPEAGCWRVVSERTDHVGEIWIEVA